MLQPRVCVYDGHTGTTPQVEREREGGLYLKEEEEEEENVEAERWECTGREGRESVVCVSV